MGRIVLYGFHIFLAAIMLFALAAIAMVFSVQANVLLFQYSAALFSLSFAMFVIDLGIIGLLNKRKNTVRFDPIAKPRISVGMTAYNDEGIIGKAVKDFLSAPDVIKVIVVDNNNTDNTTPEARKAGAEIAFERVQGYGAACKRALIEARKYGNIVCLVEGDQTFSASDLKKLVSYMENADLVVGTRSTSELSTPDSQLTWFMRYGNLFIAKLLQLRFWGTRFTDVGCTFRVIRPEALDKIIDNLQVTGNHFSPHMLIEAMKAGLKIIEVPVTLRRRGGTSKGVGSSISKGLKTGIQMWKMILLS